MSESVTVVGDKMLAATLANAARQIADMAPTNRESAEVVRARAASNAPKRTGRLAGSVRASSSSGEAVIAATAPYSAFVEYGHQTVPARPFMRNALRDTQSTVVEKTNRRCQVAMAQVRGA